MFLFYDNFPLFFLFFIDRKFKDVVFHRVASRFHPPLALAVLFFLNGINEMSNHKIVEAVINGSARTSRVGFPFGSAPVTAELLVGEIEPADRRLFVVDDQNLLP